MTRKHAILTLLAVVVLAACGKPAESAEPAEPTAGAEQLAPTAAAVDAPAAPATETETETESEVVPLPAYAAIVSHRVKDFDAWKTAFEAGQASREEAGITAHHLNRGVTDDKLVMVYLAASDLEKLKALIASPEFKASMKAAGVIGKPSIEIVTPVENRTASDATLPAAFVSHEVKDYDAWKVAFDGDASRRTEGGVIGYALNRDQAKPNMVNFYAQGQTREALEAFFASKEHKAAMKSAGVKGRPKVTLVQGVEWGHYTK